MREILAFAACVFGTFAGLADVSLVGEGVYRPACDVFENLDACIRAVDAETNGCVLDLIEVGVVR